MSILSLYFYIRDQGHKPNQILMIDEPEMNLHPKNQRAMARFLASLVNQGIKVVVSTHSDYLVRELNHLTALHKFKDEPSVKEYLEKRTNPYEASILLDASQVGVYYTELNKKNGKALLKTAELTNYNTFSVASFDDEIQNQQNDEFDILKSIFGEEEKA